MEAAFVRILNMSYGASWVILAVLAARLLLRRAPKRCTFWLWAVPFVRLLCPVSLEGGWSILPGNAAPLTQSAGQAAMPVFRSGLAAVITLCHDICVMMAFFVIFQLPVNMNFIAAALTILGYSINATIVIFDRIRENSKGISDQRVFADITDRSICQTMARSLNTSITTLIPIVLILVLGVPSIQNFAIALIVGIVSGTYSSMFIAGPLWVNLRRLGGKKTAAKKAKA